MFQIASFSPMKATLLLVLVSLFAAGCASTYKPVTLNNMVYMDTKNAGDSLKVSYRYGVQYLTNNRRYANKETKHKLAAVAVKIDNVSPVPLSLTRTNFKISSPSGDKIALSPMAYSAKVKQRVGLHMLHALWGPWQISWSEDEYGKTDVKGFYLPVGLIVGIGNAVRASNANKKSLATLTQYEIWNREIPAGGSLYGIITIPASAAEEQLTFSYGQNLIGSAVNPVASSGSSYVPKYPTKSSVFDFYVWPITGYAFDARSKIHIDEGPHYVMHNGQRIYPDATQSLSRVTESGKQFLGLPHGDKWLFKVINGKINGYFFLAEEETKAVSHIQKGDGPMLDFTPELLIQMIDGDPDALELIMRRKYIEAIAIYNSKG